jgi:O-antigen biosynthesis protein
VKIAFLVNDLNLAGGTGVILEHARQLARRHGHDVRLVSAWESESRRWEYESLSELTLQTIVEARQEEVDVAIATWWETTFTLFSVPAKRYAYFVQSLEDRFYTRHEPERFAATMTLDLPVAFITEARWIADTLGDLRPEAPCYLVRNGLDKSVFPVAERVAPRMSGPLRILIEGHPSVWFKHVHTAIEVTHAMREPHHVTVVAGDRAGLGEVDVDAVVGPLTHREMSDLYAQTDVLLKLSSVEGMYGPPLEAFHRGATCVTTEVTGHEEYIRHGWNALVTDWDDVRGTARQLDLLAHDRHLLHFLRHNALETARAWPSWDQAGDFMAGALGRIVRGPAPPPRAGTPQMLADVRVAMEGHRLHLQERAEYARKLRRFERLLTLGPVTRVLGLRASLGRSRSGRLALRAARPFTSRAKQRLLGR